MFMLEFLYFVNSIVIETSLAYHFLFMPFIGLTAQFFVLQSLVLTATLRVLVHRHSFIVNHKPVKSRYCKLVLEKFAHTAYCSHSANNEQL